MVGEEGGAGGAAGQLLGRQPLEELAGVGVSDGGALLHHVAQLACRGGKAQKWGVDWARTRATVGPGAECMAFCSLSEPRLAEVA